MGMLLKRRLYENKAEGSTATTLDAVAPQPTHEEEKVVKAKDEPRKKTTKASRQEIMKMNVATVRAYAQEQGIEGASAMSGAELKRILVNKLFDEESE